VSLFLSSETQASGVVQIQGLGFLENFTIAPFELARIDLPRSVTNLPANQISNRGISIVSDEEITVYGLNQYRYTTDAQLALPVNALGVDYRVMSYYGYYDSYPSQLSITGVYDNTEVTIAPVIRRNGVPQSEKPDPITITLNSNQTYLYQSTVYAGDLTGTQITSSAPVAVSSGAQCVNVPSNTAYCDHLVEMTPPVATWGNTFLTVPLATRKNGDVFRVLASQNDTEVSINGELVSTLSSGDFFETVLTQRSIISTSEPTLVAQYSAGQLFDGVISDPFMMLVPPSEQFLDNYTFIALEESLGFINNFVNVVAPNEDVATIVLDGELVDASLFSTIGNSGFSGAQIPISEGAHTISNATPFGIYVYGFGSYDSYGYPGGMNFDFINASGDKYSPNVKLMMLDTVIEGFAGDSEDINLNDFLDVGEDLNNNAIIDRRTEDANRNGLLDDGEDSNGDGTLDRDTGIFRIELEAGAENLELILNSFIPGTLRAPFTITVIDPSQPSSGTLVVTDGAGNTVRETISFSNEVRLQNVRVISTLSTMDIELDQTSFARTPDNIEVLNDKTVLEWQFGSIAIGQVESLDYDIVFKNPAPNESRVVTHTLDLYYDDVDGNTVHQVLGEQAVNVLPSIFAIDVATDRQDYTFDQTVFITTDLSNLSQFDALASVELVILDSNGSLVATAGNFPSLALAANETASLGLSEFNTGNTYLGAYTVRAILRDTDGAIVTQADANFNIVATTEMLYAAFVTTDKPTYSANETVVIQNRVSNPAPNAVLSGAKAVTTVFAPDNSEFWRADKTLPDIAVHSLHDFFYNLPLGTALPGDYRVLLSVLDSNGIERALSERTITVSSTEETGIGLLAVIDATPSPVLKTESAMLDVTLSNQGNSAISALPVTVSVVDLGSQQVLQQWNLGSISLAMEGARTFNLEWFANVPVGNHYAVVVNGKFGDEERVLASQPLAVAEKLLTSLTPTGLGRILVLLDDDGTNGDACKGLSQIDLRFRPDSILLPQDQLYVDLYDAQGVLRDSESLTVGSFIGPVNDNAGGVTDVVLTGATADHLNIRLQPGESGQTLNGEAYSLTITHWQRGSSVPHHSGLIGTDCADVETGQSLTQEFFVEMVLGSDGAEPYGPDGAPTKITQRRFLEALLQEAGWSYTIVNTSDDFAMELSSGGYEVAGLFNEQLKLSEAVQQQLVDAVAQGLGLLYAGYHDKRNGRIEPALGIKTSGKMTSVTGLELYQSVLQEIPSSLNLNFNFDVKPLSAALAGAESLAVFQSGQFSSEPAITDYRYGQGQSVYMGFDVLLQATTLGADSRYGQLLTDALAHVHPENLAPTTGHVLPIPLSIENVGMTVSGQVLLTLPPETSVIDPGLARVQEGNTMLWPFTVDTGEVQEWAFWLRLPDTSDPIEIVGNITIVTDEGELIDYGPVQLILNVVDE